MLTCKQLECTAHNDREVRVRARILQRITGADIGLVSVNSGFRFLPPSPQYTPCLRQLDLSLGHERRQTGKDEWGRRVTF